MADAATEKDNETGEEGFDDEFAKIAAEKDGTKLEPVFTKEDGTDGNSADDLQNAGSAGAEGKAVDGGADNPGDNEDPYAGIDDTTKARLIALEESNQQLQHRIDSDNGRVGAFQRKVNNLESQLNQINEKSDKPAPTDEEMAAAMATEESWDTFKDDYPEQALAIEGYMDKRLESQSEKIDSKISEVSETVAPVVEKFAEQDAIENYQEVENQFPGWQEEVKSSTFNTWFESQPKAVQDMANSEDAKDASDLMGLYDTYRVASDLEPLRNTDHGNSVVDNSVDEIAARRAQQLEDGTAIKSKSARIDPSAGESETEFEAVFNAIAKRKDAKQQA